MSDKDKQLNEVFDRLDDLLLAGRFSEVDDILRMVDVANELLAVLLVYLTSTAEAKPKLSARSDFYQAVASRFIMEMPLYEAEQNLQGLD
jgi:hypothetical protein